MRSVASTPLVEPFAGLLLAHDLPGLPDDRRAATVRFVSGRIDVMPSPLRAAVLAVAAVVRAAMLLPGRGGVVRAAARMPLPALGHYVRLVRSLAYAHVWETWPDTRPDGSRGEHAP